MGDVLPMKADAAAPSSPKKSGRAAILVPPLGSDAVWASGWTPAEARLAVDQWKRGTFRWGWQFQIDATSYPPIKCALDQRIASPCGLPWEVDGPTRAPGRLETEAARKIWLDHGRRLLRSTLRDIAMCGFSVWYHPIGIDDETLRATIFDYANPALTEDGSTLDFGQPTGGIQRWPISAVGWTPYPLTGVIGYYAILMGGHRVQLPRPGCTDGPWTVVGEGDTPHLDAALVSLDMEFTAGMLERRARANLGVSAGRASPYANMPPDEEVDGDIGKTVQTVLAGMGAEQMAAVFPDGVKLNKFELTTTGAAEYFTTSLRDSILLVALAVMGRGGALAKTDAQYQGPTEMDVPESLVRRDVRAIERALTGIFRMLAEANQGPGATHARLEGHLPDADQEARVAAEAARMLKLAEILKAEGAAGCLVDQDRANEVAKRLGVSAPRIVGSIGANIEEWHVHEKVVAPDQVLASLGLPSLPDGAGSPERLAAERLAGKDKSGTKASLGDPLIDGKPDTAPPDAEPAPKPTEQVAPGGDVAPTPPEGQPPPLIGASEQRQP